MSELDRLAGIREREQAGWRALAEICSDEAVSSKDFDAICDTFPRLLARLDEAEEALREIEALFNPENAEDYPEYRIARRALENLSGRVVEQPVTAGDERAADTPRPTSVLSGGVPAGEPAEHSGVAGAPSESDGSLKEAGDGE